MPAARIEQAAEWWATAAAGMFLHARASSTRPRASRTCGPCINLGLATGKYGKPGCGVTTITGQGNGQGGREHGHKCDQLPGNRDITNPEHRAYIASVWGCDDDEIPGKGLTAQEIVEAIHRGEIKGLLSICFNPVVSLPDTAFTKEALDKLDFYGVIDFFLSETAFHADLVLPGSLHEEDEGISTNVEGRVIKLNPSKTPPGAARLDWEILCDIAERLGKGHFFPYAEREEIFEELRVASKGGSADYSGITWERIERELGVFWPCPSEDHPGTPRLYEGGRFYTDNGGAGSTRCGTGRRPRWSTTTTRCGSRPGRVVSQYLSGTQTRRIGPLVDQYPEPLCEMHPRLAERHGIATGDVVRVTSGGARSPCRPRSCPRSGRTRSSSPTTGRAGRPPTS